MKRRPIVWCGSNKDYDLSAAEVYGDVNIIYPDRPKNVFNTSAHAFHIKNAMADAQASDYILVTGNLILVLLMFAVMFERFTYVNLLCYDLRSQEYVPRVVARHHVQSNRKE